MPAPGGGRAAGGGGRHRRRCLPDGRGGAATGAGPVPAGNPAPLHRTLPEEVEGRVLQYMFSFSYYTCILFPV